ncbi:TPA: S41 family peptidase [Staphylococcus aureus]|nr:S41 family peptidase [Staphylococcus aureus]HCZ7293335.1 S41 family peptidase [Staphylococcus aureus]HCZ7295912.1 S41 family peptidase [Staphylococcus aureus]HCZ7296226.1 S41 family peptidase [Staphylococcus aureus]
MDDKQHTSSSDDERAEIATSNQDQETNSSKRVHLKRWQFISILIGTTLITAVITVVAYIFINQKISGLNKTDQANLNKIENVYKILNSDYYKKQDSDKLSKAAIDGMVKELKDPYSEYLTKEQTKSFNEGVSGDFVGIGAEMQKKNDQIMVTSPMKGSPAERAGIRPKDVITKVNGKSIKGKALDEVVKDVRGKENTEVTLTVQRGSEEKDVKIKREKIHVKSVEYKKKGKDTEAIQTSNDSLKEAKDMDISILVNEGSASASEVFTGALKDYNKAKVYGSKTFGKGVVQTTREFKDGSLLKYTEMKWLTPDGHYIHGKGIKPDVTIDTPKYQSLNVIPNTKTFKVGDDDKNIKTIKIGLSALGYKVDNESTQFDQALENQVKAFQQANKLEVTGEFNKETNNKFTELLVEKANKHDDVLDKLINILK